MNAARLASPATRLGIGFAATVMLSMVIAGASYLALRSVITANDEISHKHSQALVTAERFRATVHNKTSVYRAFLFTRDHLFLEDGKFAKREALRVLRSLADSATSARDKAWIKRIEDAEIAHEAALDRAVSMRKRNVSAKTIERYFENQVMFRFDRLDRALNRFIERREDQLASARTASKLAARRAIQLIVLIASGGILLAICLSVVLTHTVTRLYRQLQEALTTRDEILSMVSHDLKTPLTAILMSAGLARRKVERGDVPAGFLLSTFETIKRSGDRMQRMIVDLIDLSRVHEDRLVIKTLPEAVPAILNEVASQLAPIAADKGVELAVLAEPGLPEARCDRERVIQILNNLMSNAIRYTPKGARIELRAANAESELVVSVRDQGPGIAEQDLPHLFERFWQGKKSHRSSAGLGLAITRSLVDAHGGRIWVESAVGKGASFYFTLPAVEKARPGLTLAPAIPTAAESQAPSS